mmetsp:Transcript_8534/g.17766  ORF Transcript_8534/g.17766 Transcript_8534/m.17766 type:complete len:499 (-) Transcript_8534:143-1639(-)|eukprot:CAMPEP_0171350400 /NCGR_PEP_ID=MMETSP0878-20121228/36307_1 /TAXON_ID=67004 /ORGANISM="Thalassiosira weissflogii, Strain CCMP1336" /LENGTH=498 /DNA_ID=CAMNT_0011855307 /DNA_START=52 /DNA_END=1548 /DNA_ORIENTATION=+
MSEQLKPLCGVLDGVLERLAAIESKLGLSSTTSTSSQSAGTTAASTTATSTAENEETHPRLTAYDAHIQGALLPFTATCTALGPEMSTIGTHIQSVWLGVRIVIELGTNYKRPSDPVTAIQPHLKPCQDAISKIRSARLDRKFDWHIKAINEMLASVSWVCVSPPPAPANFVKDTIGASDFWANKIRKEYKGKAGDEAENHIKFCDGMKGLVNDLAGYLKEYHLSGLAWNPHGRDFSEAKVGEGSGGVGSQPKAGSKVPASGGGGSGAGAIFAELKQKQSGDGSSAATGLKKVSRDQQTWRKEYKNPDGAAALQPSAASTVPKVKPTTGEKPLGPPKCEYNDRGCKWSVENQTKDTCEGGVCKVIVTDPKQQVYIYKCQNVTIQIIGKLKSVILDSCTRCAVVFDTAISACEIVNCKSVQVQATNLCPSFSIDKTDGCVVHLTNEAVGVTSFVTSKSSEMNVSWPDDDGEVKEAPIPEQFHHKIVNGSVTSQVSDLYH